MPLPRTAIYSHVTFEGSLEDEKTIAEIVEYVRGAANGPVNVQVIRQQEIEEDEMNGVFYGKAFYESIYTAWIEGTRLWLDRRHDHERRKKEDRREQPRQSDRRKHRERRSIDIGHMPKPLASIPPKPADI